MEDELEMNQRRTLMREWKSVANGPRADASEFEERCEQEREAELAAEFEQVEAERARRRAMNDEFRAVASSPRYELDPVERRQREREQSERETAAVYDWLERKRYEDEQAQQSQQPVDKSDSWNEWFAEQFRIYSHPMLEAVGEEIGKSLNEERRQSREELAAEVARLNAECQRLFAIVSELQDTIKSLGRIDRANKRHDELEQADPPRRGVH
jgi:hypothetical protein